ncbi:hypothetical protein CCM_02930 [Cordyceps militaris CM01]|uniref:Uncharacterized protein n=1 Tax=Cordyceps militaris (strain CM01) TaxID=983644 RepID=G3JCQ1_CORMM|nr:uncharacterized protein CCM_02930 [Cordyceps militaris CM01]EGX94659.1 hypothetical protein CCM_02930 [Cordyceps militaris CM01]
MAPGQPYTYSATASQDSRFPIPIFDPKAVTRASWEPKPKRKPQTGPLLSFNAHPDTHEVLQQRSAYQQLGKKTQKAIKWVRGWQLLCRVLEFNGALGILILMILLTGVNGILAWIMRIVVSYQSFSVAWPGSLRHLLTTSQSGITALHCLYGIVHHSRSATTRTPGSTAAYQLFAGIFDLATASFYAYGAFMTKRDSSSWATLIKNQSLLDYLVPAVYYTIIGAGGLHLVSFFTSLWLAITFQRISDMPPDMNPLESNLTARPSFHKRNKSSVTTYSSDNEKRLSTAQSAKHLSEASWESFSYPRSVPFMHTRTQSQDTLVNNELRLNLPQRQYQIPSGNPVAYSAASMVSSRVSAPRSSRGSYAEIALGDASPTRPQYVANSAPANNSRAPKFTETWLPTDSLISRTNNRNREATAANTSRHARGSQSYSALDQRYNADDSGSDYGDDENADANSARRSIRGNQHPNPLGLHPTSSPKIASPSTPPHLQTRSGGTSSRPTTPWTASRLSAKSALSEMSSNERVSSPWVNKPDLRPPPAITGGEFYSRSYGELRPATPPVMVGDTRKISSGNDYHAMARAAERRRVSGKVAEEGLAGDRFTIGYAS